ncbi:unnamed protein product [Sphagnum troendelagicum]|uniref:AP2/ERF domain-containing protein n=1 Tax=Sphagnum troendelagicum TaxID=128251 RepID=A0ABP0UPI0_9BRYO
MPDQKICHDGHRSVELQEFDHLAARCHGSPGLRTPSLRADRCDLNRVSAAFLAKDFDVKSFSPCAAGGGGVANGVSPLSTLLNTAQSQPLAKPSSTPASAAAPVSDSAAKASVASLKIAPRRGRPLKTVRAGPVLRLATHAAVKSLETGREVKPEPKKPKLLPQQEPVKIASDGNTPKYQGVRVRPGVKGYLVEIRPRRWKRTIWLGTYTTSPEAARAYDAGIFYTGKSIPFNFQDSEGSFPPLPKHLSLDDFDPDVMHKIKVFVKEKALQAATREKVTTTQELPHTKKKKVENESSSVGAEEQYALSCDKTEEPCILSCDKMVSVEDESSSVGAEEQCALSSDKMEEPCILSCDKMASVENESSPVEEEQCDLSSDKMEEPCILSCDKMASVENESSSVGAEEQCALSSDKEPCILFCDKMASDNYEDAHVKNQGDDGWDTITPNPFENLEPLPYELPNCSDQAFWDENFWAGIPLPVHDYKSQTGMFGDEDLNNTQQASCLMDEVLFDQCHQEEKVVVAETGFQSVFVSKSNGDSCTPNLHLWALESFDLAVQDPSQVMDGFS